MSLQKFGVWSKYEVILESAYRRLGDVLLYGCGSTVAIKRSVGTLGKKQTYRDVIGTICTRLVQIQTDLPERKKRKLSNYLDITRNKY